MVTTTQPEERGRSAAIADGLAFMARWSLRLALIGLGFALLWWLIARLWVIVMPVLLAMLITTVLNPPANWMRRRGVPPALAAAVVLVGSLLVLAAVVFFLATSITGGVSELASGAVAGLQSIQDWLAGPPLNLGATQFDALLQQVTQRLQDSVTTIATGVLTGVGTFASLVVTGLLALVLAFLFVKDGDRFLPWLRRFVGPRAGGHLCVVLGRVWDTLGGFIRGQALVSLADAILIGTGLLIVGVPLALPLAVLTFIGGFIPIVGAIFAGAVAVLIALVSNGFTAALIVLGIVLLVQQVEGNVLQPILQGKSLNLHAAVVLLAVTAGGSLYGIAGAFLAVPVAAAGAVVLRYLFAQVDRISEDDETDAPADPTAARAAGVAPAPERPGVAAGVRSGGRRRTRQPRRGARAPPGRAQPRAAGAGRRPGRAAPGERARSARHRRRRCPRPHLTPARAQRRCPVHTLQVVHGRAAVCTARAHTTTRIGRPRSSSSSPSTSAVPAAQRCADHAAASASSTSSSRAPAGRSPSAARRRASGRARRSAARRPGPSSSGANPTPGASVRSDTSGCTSTTWRGSATASQSRIFGPMWKVCRLIARPVSRRATANASSRRRRREDRPRRGGEHRRPRAAQTAGARDVAGPRRRAGGQAERDVDADRRAPAGRRQHLGGGADHRPRDVSPRDPRDHPAAGHPVHTGDRPATRYPVHACDRERHTAG